VTLYPLQFTFQDGGSLRLWATPEWHDLEQPFQPAGLRVESGRYRFAQFGVTYRPDLSRRVWAYVTVAGGGYFDGTRERLIARVRVAPSPRVALTFDYEGNRLRGIGAAGADRTTHLLYPEARLALNPRLQFTLLYQYNSVTDQTSWNARLAWEFRPLSYAYLIVNQRTPGGVPIGGGPAALSEGQVILKISYLGQM
jgi:hypothetical protein